jgi:hypothetical protein
MTRFRLPVSSRFRNRSRAGASTLALRTWSKICGFFFLALLHVEGGTIANQEPGDCQSAEHRYIGPEVGVAADGPELEIEVSGRLAAGETGPAGQVRALTPPFQRARALHRHEAEGGPPSTTIVH